MDCTDSKTYVGGIVGELYGSSASLENCLVTDMAVSGGYYTGGLVGCTEKSPQIWNCAANAEVVGGYSAGGLIGLLYSGYVYNSYAIGTVSGAQYAGGLIGWAASNSNYIYNSYSATTLSADETGGLIGLAVGTTISNSYYLEQDNLDVCGSTSGLSLNYSGSFDTSETVTAVSNCSLAYDGDLTSQLNGWVLDNYQTYTKLIGWQAQEDAYPTFSSVYLAAAGTVKMEGFEIDLNETKTLTATVTLDEGDIGTLTCQWYRDGVALSENTTVVDSSTLNDRSFFVSNDVTGSEPGLFIYTVVVENDNGYSSKSISVDATVTVNKGSGDTTWYGVVGTNFDGGTGTETDPYLISDTDTLAYLAQQVNAGGEDLLEKSYLLTTDLNLNNVLWTPIGNSENTFSGTFDGGGHTISGLLVDSTKDYQGLFGYASGTTTIKNLVVSGEVNCAGKSAGLIGFALKGSTVTISNCGNEATVNATSTYVAGLIGNLGSAKADVTTCIIENCYNSGTINGGNGTGGFIGYVAAYADVTISNCYNIGSIVSTGSTAGGIAGTGTSSATLNISNCYNAGTVSASTTADAISGHVWTAENCYYLSGRCSTAYTSGVEAFSQSDVATLNEKLGDDFVSSTAGTVSFVTTEDVSVVVDGETISSVTMAGYPLLSWQSGDTGIASVVFMLNMPDGTIATEVTVSNGGSIEQSGDEYTLVFSGDETVTVATLAVTTVTFETVTETSQSASQTFAEDSATVYASGTSGLYYVAPGDTIKFSVSVADTCALTSVSAVTTSEDGIENEVILSPDSEGLYSVTVTENTTIRCVVIARVKLSVTGNVTFTNESLNKLTKVGAIYYIVPGDSIDFTIQVSSNQLLRSVTTNDYGTIVEPDEEGVYTLSVADDATAALIYISYSKVAVTLADTEASYTYSGEAYEPA
ncbi:MAG: hypothetical protein LUH16_02360, partial [Clostridiales bacterium]|nr:hypothetical protein [Clostridiales bacterium]